MEEGVADEVVEAVGVQLTVRKMGSRRAWSETRASAQMPSPSLARRGGHRESDRFQTSEHRRRGLGCGAG
jgi:hypothetical protein